MTAAIVAYQLNRKFVNQPRDIPESARQVMYYSLAIGHHVGVIDCLAALAQAPEGAFQAWLDGLPDSPGRRRLRGVLTWGEIELNCAHSAELLPLLDGLGPPGDLEDFRRSLAAALRQMAVEPALYLMLRKRP
ncbi:MAG: formate hydrogenlyase maturation HycH family protein [Chloroflexota bacterium]